MSCHNSPYVSGHDTEYREMMGQSIPSSPVMEPKSEPLILEPDPYLTMVDEEIERRSNESIESDSVQGAAIEQQIRAIDARLHGSDIRRIEDPRARIVAIREQVGALAKAHQAAVREINRAEDEDLHATYSTMIRLSFHHLEEIDADLAKIHQQRVNASADDVVAINKVLIASYNRRREELEAQVQLTERRINDIQFASLGLRRLRRVSVDEHDHANGTGFLAGGIQLRRVDHSPTKARSKHVARSCRSKRSHLRYMAGIDRGIALHERVIAQASRSKATARAERPSAQDSEASDESDGNYDS